MDVGEEKIVPEGPECGFLYLSSGQKRSDVGARRTRDGQVFESTLMERKKRFVRGRKGLGIGWLRVGKRGRFGLLNMEFELMPMKFARTGGIGPIAGTFHEGVAIDGVAMPTGGKGEGEVALLAGGDGLEEPECHFVGVQKDY